MTPATYTYDGKTLTLPHWSKVIGIDHRTLRHRLKFGWSIEQTLTTPLLRLHRRPAAPDPAPGVSSDFPSSKGTGGGKHAHEISEISFSDMKAPTA